MLDNDKILLVQWSRGKILALGLRLIARDPGFEPRLDPFYFILFYCSHDPEIAFPIFNMADPVMKISTRAIRIPVGPNSKHATLVHAWLLLPTELKSRADQHPGGWIKPNLVKQPCSPP